MQRFELAGNKFFEVHVEGATLTTRWGKRGGEPQSKSQQFASAAAASAALAKLVAEKRAKGYREIKPKKAPKQTYAPVVVPPSVHRPRATGTIEAEELVVRELRNGGPRTSPILIDGKRVLVAGDQCLASSDGKTFHRRRTPGESFCLRKQGDAIYSVGTTFAVTRDLGASWRTIAIANDDDYPYYKFCLFRDSRGTYWMGCDDGVILESDSLDTGWKKARFEGTGKVLDIIEADGRLLFMGAGCHGIAGGRKLEKLEGIDQDHIICRVTEAPSGTLIAVGDGGVTYRSTDRGRSWTFVKSGVRADLEDLAWVAGALFAVGDDGAILRTTDAGVTWAPVPGGAEIHLWGITSWGDGALIAGDYGYLYALSSPDDAYWTGTRDELAPPPPAIDPAFEPQRAAAAAERERAFAELYAAGSAEHDRISVKAGLSRPRDANPRLARLVEEAPDDDPTPAQVYADWLQGEGDPRGELAAVQLRRATDRKNKELKRIEKDLLAQHADRLLGKLAGARELMKLQWHAGFIRSARVANTHDNDGDNGTKVIAIPDVVAWLLDEPSARFLRELTVGIVTFFENDYEEVAARIGQRYLPSLRALFLGDFESEDTELSWSELGDVEPIYAALPNLVSLKLRSGSMHLGSIVLPKLESFAIETGGLDRESAQQIASARWPALRRLSIWIGADEYGGDAQVDDFQPVFDGVGLPRLEHLALKNSEIAEQLIEPLARSKILPQLRTLDLGMGTLGDDGAQALFRLQKAFAHLEKIDLDDNFISPEGERLLGQTNLEIRFGEQRDDDGDPDSRYASAAE